MKENYKILEQNIEIQKKNNEKTIKILKNRDVGVDTTNFNEFFNNSFNFKEIKSNYLSNLISFSFLKKVGSFYQWPFLCFTNLIENSVIHGSSTIINIDINCYEDEIYKRLNLASKNTNLLAYKPPNSNLKIYDGDYSNKVLVLSIKNNGKGIDSESFNKILFCFDAKSSSLNENLTKNSEYLSKNLNIKACCLRLGDSFFVLSKTKTELNIGLISKQLQMKMNNDLILAPLVNYKIIYDDEKNMKNPRYEFKSQIGLQSENIILNEIRFLFWSIDELFSYANKFETGTHIFIFDLKQFSPNKELYNKATNFELFYFYPKEDNEEGKNEISCTNNNDTEKLKPKQNDILYNTLLKQSYLYNNKSNEDFYNVIDLSFRKYLQFFLLDYKDVTVNLMKNGIKTKNNIINRLYNKILSFKFADSFNDYSNLSNPENILIVDDTFSFNKKVDLSKINIILFNGELYKGILIQKEKDDDIMISNINDSLNINATIDEIKELKLNDILIYLDNRLVCRMGQNKFGDLPFFIKNVKLKNRGGIYKYCGLIQLPSNGLYELTTLKNEFKDNTVYSMFFSKVTNLIKKIKK